MLPCNYVELYKRVVIEGGKMISLLLPAKFINSASTQSFPQLNKH